MKKLLCLLLGAALILCAAGCGKTDAPAPPKEVNIIGDYNAEAADYRLTIDSKNAVHGISDMLYGIFFEDINFAADGGLYAEMVANRSFEFTEIAKDDALYHWRAVNEAQTAIQTESALNVNNPHYLVLKNEKDAPAGIENIGFMEGMSIAKKNYRFSVYAKALDGYTGGVTVRLAVDGEAVAEGKIDALTDTWKQYTLTLTPHTDTDKNVSLQLLTERGSVAFDMVSLFPEDTYKNRENGMRADLATLLEEMHPRFLRFPGGCVIEGFDAGSAYDWKASVGADENGEPLAFEGSYGNVAARRQGVDLWTDLKATDDEWPSFMSYGLGFFEYFQLAEDIGAVGVPVLNAGLFCQGRDGKAVEMNTPEFDKYIDDMLDLVEFCRGDKTTKWGKVRAALGHEAPFELKYICIGNENFGTVYYERYSAFLDALNRAKQENPALYKDIELIYSSGGDDGLSDNKDHLKAFAYAKEQLKSSKKATDFAGAIDSHYYNEPSWFLQNADYYDEENYQRAVRNMTDTPYGGAIPVFVGEYASLSNNAASALSEAAYMTGLERNGDIVRMAAYAPLFSSVTARHWAPNLIWFNNSIAQPSINYYVQKMFAENQGDTLLASTLDGAETGKNDLCGGFGVGTWLTAATFDNLSVTENETGKVIAQDDFSKKADFKKQWEIPATGKFRVKDGALVQSETETDYHDLGSIAYYKAPDASNYTITLDAAKNDGKEGFFIPFAVKDSGNLFLWNIGGWDNTVSCLQEVKNGKKSGQLVGTVREFTAETGRTYQLKITVNKTRIQCYIDGELYVDYDAASAEAEAYQVVSTDESGDIIVKLVNVTGAEKVFAVDIQNAKSVNPSASGEQLSAADPADENVLGEAEKATLSDLTLDGISEKFNYTVPRYSVTVLRIKTQ